MDLSKSAFMQSLSKRIESNKVESHLSPDCPSNHAQPEIPAFPVSPVSEGQSIDAELEALAAQNACKQTADAPADKSFQLARGFKRLATKIGRTLSLPEARHGFDEWHRLSLPFLDLGKSRDEYWTQFLAELAKVRVPAGEGRPHDEAVAAVRKLPLSALPMIPGWPDAPEKYRRIAAVHLEMHRLCGGKTYFLSYRHIAKVCDGLTHQEAHTITFALSTVGVIEIVSKGKAGENSHKAAEFRYLLTDSQARSDDGYEL